MATGFAYLPIPQASVDGEAAANRLALTLPASLAALMLVVGYSIAWIAAIDGSGLVLPYLGTAIAFTIVSTLLFIFFLIVRCALERADRPIARVLDALAPRMPLLLLPALVFPLFLAGFTTAKTAIPFLVGYSWDGFWADADRLIFGDDVWRITHAWLGTSYMPVWEGLYSTTWGIVLLAVMANVVLYATPRKAGVVYTAMLATWLAGGWFMAYATSAAGPIYAHLVDPALTERFAAMRAALDASLSPDGSTRITQAYLAQALDRPIAGKGGGISAMPSMHIAAVSIYVLAARRTPWLGPAIAYWLIIFIGSGYLGWHYWVDGIVAAAIAWGCWLLAEACFKGRRAGEQRTLIGI